MEASFFASEFQQKGGKEWQGFFQEEIGQGEGDRQKKKKNRAEERMQNTQEDEPGFVHTLSPKQKAEYESLDKEQKNLVKYVLGVPGVDVTGIELAGSGKKKRASLETPPLPRQNDSGHSGSGRAWSISTSGGGTGQAQTGSFSEASGTLGASTSGRKTPLNTNGAVSYLQSLQDEERRKNADPALVGTLAAGLRGDLAPSALEMKDKETVWQRALNTFLSGIKNSAADFTDAARTLYAAGQGGRTRDMQELLDSAARGLEMAERQLAYAREHLGEADVDFAQNSVDYWKRQVDAYGKVLNENIQQRATQQTAELADDLQLSAQKDIDKAKEGLGWFGRGMVDAGTSFTQMAGDTLLGAVLGPGGGTLPLLMRSFGSGTMEARQGGGTLEQQLLSGGFLSGVELLTEKLSSAALPFKLAYGDADPALERKLNDLIAQAVRKFTDSPTGQRILGGALNVGRSFVTEGLEEFVGDWLEWQLPRLYGGDVNSFSEQLASSLNSFFTGGLAGLYGAAVDPGTYGYEVRSYPSNGFNASSSVGLNRVETIWQKTLRDNDRELGIDNSFSHDNIASNSIQIGKSLGAARKHYDILDLLTGTRFDLQDGTHLQNVEVFAGKGAKTPYRNAYRLASAFGGKEENWQHVKGIGVIDFYGEPRRAELHWSQCEGYGKHDFFIKRWLE